MVNHRAQNGFWHRPQRVWLRRALFQVHLWVGIVLSLYCVLIGVSGSVLVFEDELAEWSYPNWMKTTGSIQLITAKSVSRASETIQSANPSWHLGYLYSPGVRGTNYVGVLSQAGKYRYAFASSHDFRALGGMPLDQGWLNWVADLHFRLLGGPIGFIVNGIGALCLLILCLSGIVIWWPGVQKWTRALTVNFGRRWRRINFDLHSAIGFWTIAIMALWALSGVYFVWPQAFVSAVSVFSKSTNASAPQIKLDAGSSAVRELPLETWIAAGLESDPTARIQAISFGEKQEPSAVMLTHGDGHDFLHTTWVYVDPHNKKIVGFWRTGENKTVGDWFIWLLEPLHFGTYWGMGVKILWAALGIMLPLLSVTGVLMYWNRYLRHKWRSLKTERHAVPEEQFARQEQ
jgi:uncharacterized iron-regulated membrane protein